MEDPLDSFKAIINALIYLSYEAEQQKLSHLYCTLQYAIHDALQNYQDGNDPQLRTN